MDRTSRQRNVLLQLIEEELEAEPLWQVTLILQAAKLVHPVGELDELAYTEHGKAFIYEKALDVLRTYEVKDEKAYSEGVALSLLTTTTFAVHVMLSPDLTFYIHMPYAHLTEHNVTSFVARRALAGEITRLLEDYGFERRKDDR